MGTRLSKLSRQITSSPHVDNLTSPGWPRSDCLSSCNSSSSLSQPPLLTCSRDTVILEPCASRRLFRSTPSAWLPIVHRLSQARDLRKLILIGWDGCLTPKTIVDLLERCVGLSNLELRDGCVEDGDPSKIYEAIANAGLDMARFTYVVQDENAEV